MPNNYNLAQAKAEEFYGYATPAEALHAAAHWVAKRDLCVIAVNMNYDTEAGDHGARVLYEA